MGTIVNKNGYKLIIRTRDHKPPHVHVLKSGSEILFYLGSKNERPSFREIRGKLTPKECKEAFELVCEFQEALLEKWEEYYGSLES